MVGNNGGFAITLGVCLAAMTSLAAAEDGALMYVGTGQGIYAVRMDPATGALAAPALAVESKNANFLALHPSGKFLYACAELTDAAGAKSGGVASFTLDPATGKLAPLNQQPSGGRGPCYVAVDKTGGNLLVANYGSGSVACLPIGADGKLKEPSAVIQHEGSSGVIAKRQEGPHAHSINLDAANRLAFAADLGLDKVMVYAFNPAKGSLTPHAIPFAELPPGGGPRHMAWHPGAKYAYVCNEMGDSVSAFAYDAEKGRLSPIGVVTTLPEDYDANDANTTAEVVVHASGKFLYCSNRGHDSIAVFAIGDDGKLTPRGHASTQGQVPRNFVIDPSGQFLLAANQRSGSIVVFRIDPQSGTLTPTGSKVEVAGPTCLRFQLPAAAHP